MVIDCPCNVYRPNNLMLLATTNGIFCMPGLTCSIHIQGHLLVFICAFVLHLATMVLNIIIPSNNWICLVINLRSFWLSRIFFYIWTILRWIFNRVTASILLLVCLLLLLSVLSLSLYLLILAHFLSLLTLSTGNLPSSPGGLFGG